MKIKRFNENSNYDEVDRPHKSDFIENFKNSFGGQEDTLPEWISSVASKTKLKEYKECVFDIYDDNFVNFDSKALIFAKEKGLKNYEEYIETGLKVQKLNVQVKNLTDYMEETQNDVDSDIFCMFQEELLEKDPDGFYKVFLKELDDENYLDDEIHQLILNKYRDKIELLIQAKKYNL